MTKRIVAIDVDSSSIRLLEVQGNRVERWATAPLDTGVVEGGVIADPHALAAQIRRLRRSSGIKGREVVASVSSLFSVSRILNVLAAAQVLAGQSLAEQAREAIPAPDLQLHWQTMRATETGQHVLVVGANEEQINAQAGVLRAAGLAPKVMEFKTMAMGRAIGRDDAIIVNIEPSSLDIVLMVGGLPQVMRTVAAGGMTTREEFASQVAQGLEHTASYYASSHEGKPLPPQTPVFLVGPLAEDSSLRQQIAERVEYPLESFVPPLELPPNLPAAQYAVNIGLALRQAAGARSASPEGGAMPLRINLVPRHRRWVLSPRQTAAAAAFLAGVALAYFLFQLGSNAGQELDLLRNQRTNVENRVTIKRLELNKLSQLEATVGDFKKLTESKGYVTEAVEYIQSVLTPGISLGSISVEATKAIFSASADSVEEAFDFVEALRATGRFGDVPFPRPATSINATLNLIPSQP